MISPAVRVGIIVFVALVALGLVAWFLTDYQVRVTGYPITVIYNDAMGVTTGAEVRMAGVSIGVVDRVDLGKNERAVMLLRINRKYRIPVGSKFILKVGMLISEKYIDIAPNREAKRYLRKYAVVYGEVPPTFEDLIPKAQKLLDNLNVTTENLNKTLGSKEFQERINRSLANIESATARLNATMAAIQGTIITEQDEIETIINNVSAVSENLRLMTMEIEQFTREGGLKENIAATLNATRQAAESLERTTANVEKLVTAPEFQEDIRETVKGAREAVEQAQEVLGRVERIFGKGPLLKTNIPTRETSLDALYRPDDGRFRATAMTTIPLPNERFLKLGLYDIGEGNKLILQPGQALDSRMDLRYGLYASKLGLGLDYAFSSKTFGSLNLYGSKEPTLDLQAGYKVTDDWGILLGVDRLLDENQLTLGVRLTR